MGYISAPRDMLCGAMPWLAPDFVAHYSMKWRSVLDRAVLTAAVTGRGGWVCVSGSRHNRISYCPLPERITRA